MGDNDESLVMPFSMNDGDALFQSEYYGDGSIDSTSSLTMYGGWNITSFPFPDGTVPENYNPQGFIGLRNNGFETFVGDSNAPTVFNLLLAWRLDQFSPLAGGDVYTFESESSQSTLRIDITSLVEDGENEIHFIVLNHDTGEDVWYVSEASFTNNLIGEGYWELTEFSGSAEAGKRWASFTPTANDVSLPDLDTLVFAPKTFDDVRAVGFTYRGSRWQYHYLFGFNKFFALGTGR